MITFRNELLELGSVRVSTGRFPKHTHDEFVISANVNGHERVWIDGKTFEADTSTLTTYNPGELQSSEIAGADVWLCASLYVRPDAFERYFHATFEFDAPYAVRPDFTRELISMVSMSSDADIEERCVSLLHRLIAPTSRAAAAENRAGAQSRIKRVQTYLLSDLSVVPDLQSLAASEGISAAHLVRSFHRETGLPPLAWQMQQRIAHARTLLRSGHPIAMVALDAGFADQAHFTKAFVRFMGMTPGQFRQINS
ncbi:AraC family transcriptional regulator [Paraburkholderia sp.]|uniref:AraC family transcriptional regulator n=1 Tax=Paraburkholderia sp. TaxID=1926495 RepID=UPI00239BF0C3|nr:AraC family transcriptional regulator [Paraburkholderia sp.]MDE1180547.1 AraC family transcriptional regulator [Paraburkholderia sp.]